MSGGMAALRGCREQEGAVLPHGLSLRPTLHEKQASECQMNDDETQRRRRSRLNPNVHFCAGRLCSPLRCCTSLEVVLCDLGRSAPDHSMPTAIVLLKIDHRKVTGTAEKLLEIRDITDVFSVSGRFDLLVIIKCDSIDKIECVITDELLKTEGIIESETLFAFRSYDKLEGGRAVDVD